MLVTWRIGSPRRGWYGGGAPVQARADRPSPHFRSTTELAVSATMTLPAAAKSPRRAGPSSSMTDGNRLWPGYRSPDPIGGNCNRQTVQPFSSGRTLCYANSCKECGAGAAVMRAVHRSWRFRLLAAALAFVFLLLFAQPHQHLGASPDGQQCVACAAAQLSSTPAQTSLSLLPPRGGWPSSARRRREARCRLAGPGEGLLRRSQG